MKRMIAVMMALMLLCACGTTETPLNANKPDEGAAGISQESSSENSTPSSEEEIPEGYQLVEFEKFAVLLCDDSFAECAPEEKVTVSNHQFVGNDERVIAELLSVEEIADKDKPFAAYDEKYADSVNSVELSFNGRAAKKYHIQKQADPSVSLKTNEIFYCIELGDEMLTIAYYPAMGLGGLHTENIETVLSTIRLK